MSKFLIENYYVDLDKLLQVKANERVICDAFHTLLKEYVKKHNYLVVKQVPFDGTMLIPDGCIFNQNRIKIGYFEDKGPNGNIYDEIEEKLSKGYPTENILFQNSLRAVLYQNGKKLLDVDMTIWEDLDKILTLFVGYKSELIKNFEYGTAKFNESLKDLIKKLAHKLTHETNPRFLKSRKAFLNICVSTVNKDVSIEEVNDLIIQHILTEDLFLAVFEDSFYHRYNNVAKELNKVIEIFLSSSERVALFKDVKGYYDCIKNFAASLGNNQDEKTRFLNRIYENFYKVYSKLSADKLGVVYTPIEVVNFMLKSTEDLLQKQGMSLRSKDVTVIDPCVGTGTFITSYMRFIGKHALVDKYNTTMFCNEISLLSYYIANINIERIYNVVTGQYENFENICLADTLDIEYLLDHCVEGLGFVENSERLRRQNKTPMTVILGNPPYNIGQSNANNNNANNIHEFICGRIKDTYVLESTAQKTACYDMYVRFIRWASDRIGDSGIISFITNNSYIDSKSFDGFRKVVAKEFNEIYIVDLQGNLRKHCKDEGENIFNVQVGVAIIFLVKNKSKKFGKIYYNACNSGATARDKLAWLTQNDSILEMPNVQIFPDKNANWINLTDNTAWDSFVPLYCKDKNCKESIFELNSLGVETKRDEWVYDFNKENLGKRVQYFINEFNNEAVRWQAHKKGKTIDFVNKNIKWSEDTLKYINDTKLNYNESKLVICLYRPFVRRNFYCDSMLSDRLFQMPNIFPTDVIQSNVCIGISGLGGNVVNTFVINSISDRNFMSVPHFLPLYHYKNGTKQDNITNWALNAFQAHYNDISITKEDIFYYIYGVLNNDNYVNEYKIQLKREYPRIPFYADFRNFAEAGRKLADLHLNYESVMPYNLERIETPEAKLAERPTLKLNKADGTIKIDNQTTLAGVPQEALKYTLGARTAIEHILNEYKKESNYKTREGYVNDYDFNDYKEDVIKLISRVITVSGETIIIKEQIKELK